jgi:hypothetical protein
MNYYNECIMVREQKRDELREVELRALLRQVQRPHRFSGSLIRALTAMRVAITAAASYMRTRFAAPVAALDGDGSRQVA